MIRQLSGPQIHPYLDDAARLRISVFREFPYLYAGDITGELDYLKAYSDCRGSVFILASVGDKVVGVSTGLPLASADPAFQEPFERSQEDLDEWFYFGESVLEPDWRGQGIGHQFFDGRIAAAAAAGFTKTCFCAVERPLDHPLRPDSYRTHESFWRKRGFVKQSALVARFAWTQVDSDGAEVENDLVFWTRCPTG